ncbi:Heavy metal transport/detoxification superfamily protein [Forsythia ovata]|uniref:Heavy metal transport/detoxification superfamily protein n=1 Tax=Forsythia ovata TaxID=205694 RepID=A0ABD1S536_9LAMI
MKQKIVIKVTMGSEKMRSKGMQIALDVRGVTSVTIDKENDNMVVIGEGIDVACLIKSLRKKFHFVEIVSIEEVKPPPDPPSPPPCLPPPCYYPSSCQPYYECPVYDQNPPNCSIM